LEKQACHPEQEEPILLIRISGLPEALNPMHRNRSPPILLPMFALLLKHNIYPKPNIFGQGYTKCGGDEIQATAGRRAAKRRCRVVSTSDEEVDQPR